MPCPCGHLYCPCLVPCHCDETICTCAECAFSIGTKCNCCVGGLYHLTLTGNESNPCVCFTGSREDNIQSDSQESTANIESNDAAVQTSVALTSVAVQTSVALTSVAAQTSVAVSSVAVQASVPVTTEASGFNTITADVSALSEVVSHVPSFTQTVVSDFSILDPNYNTFPERIASVQESKSCAPKISNPNEGLLRPFDTVTPGVSSRNEVLDQDPNSDWAAVSSQLPPSIPTISTPRSQNAIANQVPGIFPDYFLNLAVNILDKSLTNFSNPASSTQSGVTQGMESGRGLVLPSANLDNVSNSTSSTQSGFAQGLDSVRGLFLPSASLGNVSNSTSSPQSGFAQGLNPARGLARYAQNPNRPSNLHAAVSPDLYPRSESTEDSSQTLSDTDNPSGYANLRASYLSSLTPSQEELLRDKTAMIKKWVKKDGKRDFNPRSPEKH